VNEIHDLLKNAQPRACHRTDQADTAVIGRRRRFQQIPGLEGQRLSMASQVGYTEDMTELQIQDNDAGQTLEKYLQKALPALPRSLMFKAVRNKKIKVNRKRCEVRQMLQAGDIVQLFLPPDVLEQEAFVPNDRPLRVVWEDDDLMVLYKPRGLLSQKDQPGKQDDMNSRLRTLLWKRGIWNPETDRSFRPSVAHRLDRNTSGLVLAGKTAAGARKAAEMIRQGNLEKEYLATVEGVVDRPQELRLFLKKEGTKALVRDTPEDGWLHADMDIEPVGHAGNNTVIRVHLLTGRFHQIRASMAHIGHPLAGDVKYGGQPGQPYSLESCRLCFDGHCIEMPQK